jgi:hypothetical protein
LRSALRVKPSALAEANEMCAALLNLQQATTEELQSAIDRKLRKFGAIERMPLATRVLVLAGKRELERRDQQGT